MLKVASANPYMMFDESWVFQARNQLVTKASLRLVIKVTWVKVIITNLSSMCNRFTYRGVEAFSTD